MLQDMVLAAVNEALRMAEELQQSQLGGAAGGFDPMSALESLGLGGMGGLGGGGGGGWRARRQPGGAPNRAARRARRRSNALARPAPPAARHRAVEAAGHRQAHRPAARVPRPAHLRRGRARARRRRSATSRSTSRSARSASTSPRARAARSASTSAATPSVICVVEEPGDVIPIERTHEFRGRYHVLGGALSPIDGVEPEDLQIAQLYAPRRPTASARSCSPRTRPRPARRPRCTSPTACTSARPTSRSPGSPPACRSAATSSTPTRSRSAARSPAAARSRPRAPATPRRPRGARSARAPSRPRPARRAPAPACCARVRRVAERAVGARGVAQRGDDPRRRLALGASTAARRAALAVGLPQRARGAPLADRPSARRSATRSPTRTASSVLQHRGSPHPVCRAGLGRQRRAPPTVIWSSPFRHQAGASGRRCGPRRRRQHAARGRDGVDVQHGVAGPHAAVRRAPRARRRAPSRAGQPAVGLPDQRGGHQRRVVGRDERDRDASWPGRRRASSAGARREPGQRAAASRLCPARGAPSAAPARRRAPLRPARGVAGSAAIRSATTQPPTAGGERHDERRRPSTAGSAAAGRAVSRPDHPVGVEGLADARPAAPRCSAAGVDDPAAGRPCAVRARRRDRLRACAGA